MSKRKRGTLTGQKNSGFTLIEVMVSLGIIAVVFVVLLSLRNKDIRINDYARNITIATLLAKERMAMVDMKGFPEPGISSGSFEGTVFSWEEEINYTFLERIREVRISVLWKTYPDSPNTRQVDFTTFLIDQ